MEQTCPSAVDRFQFALRPHAPLPKGPAGQFGLHTFFSHMLMSYSKNQKAAKEFLRWMHTPANYEKWFMSQKGFATP